MSYLRFILIALLFSLPAQAGQWTFNDVSRVVALSDLHGAHDSFLSTLRAAKVINASGGWTGADAHLVIVGDILDRGPDSRKILDFLMQLEPEALAAGGRVHVLLGNHEVMNLVGDLRYVAADEFAAFAGDADPSERDAQYASLVERDGDSAPDRAEFDERFPPGFFAHRRAFSASGEYGSWLLRKPLMVVINETAFVHGGLTPLVAEMGLVGINQQLMDDVRHYLDILPDLYDAGALHKTDGFYEHPTLLEQFDPGKADDTAAQIETAIALNMSPVHDSNGPLWYRGNIACSALVEVDRLDVSLAAIGASRVVIGHMPTPTREITSRFDGRVIEIDTGMYAPAYRGFGTALILDGDSVSSVREPLAESRPLVPHPRQIGLRPKGYLPLDGTLKLLAHGDLGELRDAGEIGKLVTVSDGERTLEARFDVARGKDFYPELAAFRLDRHLGLDIVPATVVRTVGTKSGTLQLHIPHAVSEAERAQSGRGGSARCALADQWKSMYQFDKLIYNEGRTQQSMLYDTKAGWQLMSTRHQLAFAPRKGTPDYLRSLDLSLNKQWLERLAALTDTEIETLFADVLDKRRRRSLASRRDAMLAP